MTRAKPKQTPKPSTRTPQSQINIKLSKEEIARIERAKERLAARMDPKYRVTARIVILEALERLEVYLDKLDRDKDRDR
jgi:hypothetical protein